MSDPEPRRLRAADTTEPGAGDTVDEGGLDQGRPPSPKRRVRLSAIAVAIALAIGGGVAWKLGDRVEPTIPRPGPYPEPEIVPPTDFENALQHARSCFDLALESPDWSLCEAGVQRVLDEDPIHEEALALQRRLGTERTAHAALQKATQALGFSRAEDAFELLEQVPANSMYFSKAYELVRREIAGATKVWAERCQKYASGSKWPQAVVDCGWFMRVTCANSPAEELAPPPGQKLCTRRSAHGCWTPKSEQLFWLLQARAKTDPGGPAWVCVRHPMYLEPKAAAPAKPVASPFHDPVLDRAFALYLRGDANEATTQLQKLQERTEKADQHAKARALQRDISSISGLVKQGQTELAQGKLEAAARAFDEALELDRKLVVDGESTFRKTVQTEMSEACLQHGQGAMARGDAKTGCKTWKLGYRFSRANLDLLTALNDGCTARGVELLKTAEDCAALAQVLDFAVDGDGLKDDVTARRAKLHCP